MNYELEIQKSFPSRFDSMSGDLPPLVAGSGSSTLVTTPLSYVFAGFNQGQERQPFSLELWHIPTSNAVIIGHTDEGLIYEDGDYILRMKFNDATFIEGRWTAPEDKAYHLVVTYDASQFSLYADAERVLVLDVPDLVSFESIGQPLTLGAGIYDSLALYYRVLTLNDVMVHYSWGRDVLTFKEIAAKKNAISWTLAFDDVDISDTIVFDSSNWSLGLLENIASTDPLRSDGQGAWETMVPLASLATESSGIYLSWHGRGVTVTYSIDGTNWTPVNNKVTLMEDQDLANVFLYLRAELADSDSYLDDVTLHLMNNRVMQPYSGSRELSFYKTSMDETPGHQLDYQADQGATIRAGYIQINADLNEAAPVRSIEFWAKTDTPITVSVPVVATYQNGVSGQWSHYVLVLDADTLGDIRIAEGMNVSIGALAAYSTVLTQDDANRLYSYNVGAASIQIVDSGRITMTEATPAYDIYAYVWSIVSG